MIRIAKYLFVIALGAAGFFLWVIYAPLATQGKIEITIPEGTDTHSIGTLLAEASIVRSRSVFLFYVKVLGVGSEMKAGTYFFENPNLYRVVVDLVRGSAPLTSTLTFIEGWTRKEMAHYFATQTGMSADLFLNATDAGARHKLSSRYGFLGGLPVEATLDGYLFPDTYFVGRQASADDVVEMMVANFLAKTKTIAADGTSLPESRTLFEIVTLASIIEREVQGPDDMSLAAGVFARRLSMGMPLQADSTVNYITGGTRPSVTLDETKIDNPYNTYAYAGLPPGPISNPGLVALRAAFSPPESEYLYFLTTPSGETIFSKSFDEHVRAKQRYLSN